MEVSERHHIVPEESMASSYTAPSHAAPRDAAATSTTDPVMVVPESSTGTRRAREEFENVDEQDDEPRHKKRRRGGKPRVNRRDRAMY